MLFKFSCLVVSLAARAAGLVAASVPVANEPVPRSSMTILPGPGVHNQIY